MRVIDKKLLIFLIRITHFYRTVRYIQGLLTTWFNLMFDHATFTAWSS